MKELGKKYLSLEEAEEMIDFVIPRLRKLKKINKTISILDTLEIVFDDDYKDMVANVKLSKRFHSFYYLFYKEIDYLLSIGCIVRDANKGLVDFYSSYRGKEIFLCWRLGENKINYWHEIDSGYKKRKPISLLKNG